MIARQNDVLGRCKGCGAGEEDPCMCEVSVRARYSEDGSAEIERLEALDVADVTFTAWRKLGGCGLSHRSEVGVGRAIGSPIAHWASRLTLREITAAYPIAGRELARFGEEQPKSLKRQKAA